MNERSLSDSDSGELDGRQYVQLVAQHTQRMALSLDREDLTAALEVSLDRAANPLAIALVVGPCDSGKTSLINGLVGTALLPVDILGPTACPTVVSYGPEFDSVLNVLVAEEGGDPKPFRRPVSRTEMPDYVTGRRRVGEGQRIESIGVQCDRALLKSGVVLVDTPSLVTESAAAFVRTILAQAGESCDLVIYVLDAAQELTRSDVDFMSEVVQSRVPLVCVRTKTDLFAHWRRVLDLDVGHLSDAGLAIEMFVASCPLRYEALALDDQQLNDASGFPRLAQHLALKVLPHSHARAVEQTLHLSRSSLAQLASALRVQKEVLSDPTRSSEVTAKLRSIERRAEALRTGSSLWRDRLQVGVEELQVDFEHELRRRVSELQDRVLSMIEEGDPSSIWADLTADLQNAVTRTVVESFTDLHAKATALSSEVARLFGDEEEAVLSEGDIEATRSALAKFRLQDRIEADKAESGGFSLGILALRGSAGGLSVAALLTRFAVVDATAVVFTPIVAVLALVMGKKALDSGRRSHVQARRRAAIAACKRYFDGVMLEVGKRSRQELLSVRTEVRSYLEDRAQVLAKQIVAERTAAEDAVRVQAQEVPARLESIDATLRQIGLIDAHATRALGSLRHGDHAQRAAEAIAQARS